MITDFALWLVFFTFLTGGIALIDRLWVAPTRGEQPMPWWIDYSRSFFPIFLIVLILRSFIVEPYRIPTPSLVPTLLVGDFILVNKFDYGLRLPVLNKKIVNLHEPKLGDIVVFRWPPNPTINYIKRIVALPGDKIAYKDKQLFINGNAVEQKHVGFETERDPITGEFRKVEKRSETINGITHMVYLDPEKPATDFETVVPAGHYFAMGDNRDDSADSRMWGFVPEANLVGRAFAVWMSWDSDNTNIRWRRMATMVQ